MTDTLPRHPDPTARILVVDDEPELRALLNEYLTRQGFQVAEAADAAAARRLLADDVPALAILDVNMPGESGLSLARWLREAHPSVGLLMLTTANASVDRIVGLEIGADDYVPKPFDLRELLARLRALQRRARRPATQATPRQAPEAPAPSGTIRFGHCQLELDTRRLLGPDGAEITLTAAEFDLLALFARHPRRPLSRDQIMEQAHGRSWDVFDRSIDLRIMRLRRKIETNPDKPAVLKTARGIGYVFDPT